MSVLSEDAMEALLAPYLGRCEPALVSALGAYLDLLIKWNERTNLTAIRDPEAIVRRHFGESLFAARHLGQVRTLLDYGSGAGFPGIPIALLRSGISVTLVEAQGKKAAFLREAVRVLGLSVSVWANRAEALPTGLVFDCVTLRAVDRMDRSLANAWKLATSEVCVMTTSKASRSVVCGEGFHLEGSFAVPDSIERLVLQYKRSYGCSTWNVGA